jgi:acyl-CoA thioesterase-1
MRTFPFVLALILVACRGDSPASPAPAAPSPGAASPGASGAEALRQDSITVLFFGDSLTEGYGLAGGKSQAYPALVADLAREEGLPVRVVNAGVSGNTSADGRARIEWTLARSDPDVFVLALGGNDGLRGLPPEAMRENLRAILATVRRTNPDARLLVAGMEALPNLGSDYTTRYRDVFPTLAQEFDATLLPFLLDGVAGVRSLNQFDGLHPTPAGQEIIAETVWEVLEPMVDG